MHVFCQCGKEMFRLNNATYTCSCGKTNDILTSYIEEIEPFGNLGDFDIELRNKVNELITNYNNLLRMITNDADRKV